MLFIIQKIDYPYVKQCCIEDFCPGNDAHASSMAYVFSCCLNNYIKWCVCHNYVVKMVDFSVSCP